MKRFQFLLRVMLCLCAVILIGFSLKGMITPQFHYIEGETQIDIAYSHLWHTECVDVAWTTRHIETISIAGESTIGDEQRSFCNAPYGPIVSVQLPGGRQIEFSRETLWRSIQSSLWLAAVCLSLAIFWPRHNSFVLVGTLVLLGVIIWVLLGTPALPLSKWLGLISTSTSLGRILALAVLVPVFYWNVVPPAVRIPFLLGVGLLTFISDGTAFEYLLLLAVLIVWISVLWPRAEPTSPQSGIIVILCGLLLGVFALSVVLTTSPFFNTELPLTDFNPLLYALLLCVLGLFGWQIYRSAAWQFFVKGIAATGLLLGLFYLHSLPEIADSVHLLPVSTIFLTAAALLLAILAFRIGPNLAAKQGQMFINGGILLMLTLFITFKLPQASLIGWAGFSYIAFRLLHVLLEHRQKTPLPALETGQFALYATFFSAQQVGPIALLPDFGPQTQSEKVFSWNDYGEGWQRILWGAIKKFFIADVLFSAIIPGTVPLSILTPATAWVQLYAYALYLYCDFSGFVDIALGLARLVGYRLPENFDAPYIKGSLAQFWQSWHITLSSWIRTYAYLPLSRSLLRTRLKRSPLTIVLIANLVTMLLIGLWHGFALRFVVWGFWHALGLFIHKAFSDRTRRQQIKWRGTWRAQAFHVFSVLLTFHFVVLGWIFFALPSVNEALTFLKTLVGVS